MEILVAVAIVLVSLGIVAALFRVISKKHQKKLRREAEQWLETDSFYRTLGASDRTFSTSTREYDYRRTPISDKARHPMIGRFEVESQTFAETVVSDDSSWLQNGTTETASTIAATKPVDREGAYPDPIGHKGLFGDSYSAGYGDSISKEYGASGSVQVDSSPSYSSSSSSDSSSSYSSPSYDSGSSSSSSFDGGSF